MEGRLSVRECARIQTFPDEYEFVIKSNKIIVNIILVVCSRINLSGMPFYHYSHLILQCDWNQFGEQYSGIKMIFANGVSDDKFLRGISNTTTSYKKKNPTRISNSFKDIARWSWKLRFEKPWRNLIK